MSGHDYCPDRTSDVNVPMDTTFAEMHLINEKIRKGLQAANFIIPSPVQRKAIPRTLCGYDTIFKSKSGTGKTAVFAITALQSILDLESNQPQVLILAPTREIAVQIVDVIKAIGACISGVKIEYFIGGTNLQDDKEKLKNCRIVVGAPGRIAHLIELKYLNTNSIRLFVVDEADQMLQSSFHKDFNFIFNSLPESKQALICSATFTLEQINFLHNYMTTFSFISGDEEDDLEDQHLSFASLVGVKQFVSTIPEGFTHSASAAFVNKLNRLLDLLKTTTFSQCLVFTNYITRVKTISNKLTDGGFPSSSLCSEQEQSERIQALKNLKDGGCRVLVSTDLAARGIDAQNVNLVINLEVPNDQQTYLHRMGRAGRYGSYGIVITLAAEGDEISRLQAILRGIKASVSVLPTQPSFVDAMDKKKVQKLALKEISGLTSGAAPPTNYSSCTDCTDSVSINALNGSCLRDNYESQSFCSSDSKENICPSVLANENKSFANQSYLSRPVPIEISSNQYGKAKEEKLESQLKEDCKLKSQTAANLVLDGAFLRRQYSSLDRTKFITDVDCNQIKSSVGRDFIVMQQKSSKFCSKLKPRLMGLGLLSSDALNFSAHEVTNKNIKNYFLLCKNLKSMNQNIVEYVEMKLRDTGNRSEDNFWRPNRTTGSRLPANLIKRKPEWAQKQINPDPIKLKSKYLYLRQDFLKRLYSAKRINKDFCVENLRADIEPRFYQMWKAGKLTMANIVRLSELDLLQQPLKSLNSQSLEPYFQFCRHFIYLNPELVTSISKKIHKIEMGLTLEETDKDKEISFNTNEIKESEVSKKTEMVAPEILSPYKCELQTLANLDTDGELKKKILEKLSANNAYILDLKRKVGPNLLVEQSFNDTLLLAYLKLCQTFKNADPDFLSEAQLKLSWSPSTNKMPSKNEDCKDTTSSLKDPLVSASDKDISKNSCKSSNLSQNGHSGCSPSTSDFNHCDKRTSPNYEDLKQYPPCKASTKSTHATLRPQFSSALRKAMFNLAKSAEKDCVLKSEDSVIPPVFNLLKSTRLLCQRDVENFTEKDCVVHVKTDSDECKSETDNYQKILLSLHNHNEPKSTGSSSIPTQTLSQEDKSAINTFLQSHALNQNHVSFSSSVKPEVSVSLLFKDENLPSVSRSHSYDQQNSANLNLGGKSVSIFSGEKPQNLDLPSQEVGEASNCYQVETVPVKKSRAKVSSTQNDTTVKKLSQQKPPCQAGKTSVYDSSDSISVDTTSDTDSNEDGSDATLKLCDHCKAYFKSAKSSQNEATKKSKPKRSSKKISNNSITNNIDCPIPSYEQLLQWYNMWYQQVVYSQQFMWYNAYIRSMSSEK